MAVANYEGIESSFWKNISYGEPPLYGADMNGSLFPKEMNIWNINTTDTMLRPVLRLFPPCALISHAQGSSGVVDNMLFAWRGHTKRLATWARSSPDLAVWLE